MALDYGNYGIFLVLDNARFISSTVGSGFWVLRSRGALSDGVGFRG